MQARPVQPNDRDEDRQPPRFPLLPCVLLALVVPAVGSVVYFIVLGPTRLATAAYVATKLFTVVWPLAVWMLIERQADRLRVRWTARPLPLGAVTGLAIGGLILLAYRVPALHAYAQQFGPTIRERLGVFGVDSAASYGLFCAFLAVLHSGIEEYYWRWYVFGTLLRFFPMGPSVLVAALGFAAHHYVVLGCYFGIGGALVFGTGVGIGGALWCWMMRRQDSVLGAWLSHALVDAAIFVVGYDLVFASQ